MKEIPRYSSEQMEERARFEGQNLMWELFVTPNPTSYHTLRLNIKKRIQYEAGHDIFWLLGQSSQTQSPLWKYMV
jgi:hypothetical protein